MRRTLAALLALFVADGILMVGSGLLGTLLSVRMTLNDYSTLTTGVVMTAFNLGLIVGSFLDHRAIRRVGHIRAFATFAAVNTAAVMLHALYLDAVVWGVLRFVTGFCMMGLYMVMESWLNERAAREIRGRVFSIYMAISFLGLGLGQLLLMSADVNGQRLFLLIGMLFSLCLVPVAMTRAAHPEPVTAARLDILGVLRAAPVGIVGCFAAGMINAAFFALAPVFGLGVGLNMHRLSWFMGATVLCGLLLQWPVGMLSDRFDRRRVLVGISLAVAAVSAVIPVVTSWLAVLLVAVGVYGGLAFTVYPVAVAFTHDHVEPDQVVQASAALLFAYGVGALIGPVAAAGAMEATGPAGLYIFIAAVSGAYALAAGLLRRRPPEESQVPFIPMSRSSPVVVVNLDPRVDPEGTLAGESGAASDGQAAESPPPGASQPQAAPTEAGADR